MTTHPPRIRAQNTRAEMWQRLGASEVDVLVVGGGVTGAGIARDAARRGLSVALVEMRDFASGTSSKSSKLVHGGFRYLEHYEFGLVFESVSERRALMDMAPHLVNPVGFLFPVYEGFRHPLWFINVGMWIYDGLSLFRSPKIHKKLKAKQVAELEPTIRQDGLEGAPLYYDCMTDDARLTLETAIDAAREGAILSTWSRVDGFLRDGDRIVGATVVDELGTGTKEVRARVVINATGPWTDDVLANGPTPPKRRLLRPTKGVHLVVDAEKLPVKHAVVCTHPEDRRVLFAIPWGDQVYIGTTDTDYDGRPEDVRATREDVRYLLTATNHQFPDHQLTEDDVLSTWAGLRPLIGPGNDSNEDISESEVSREHEIRIGRDGLVTIAGGKLTTYRRMAAETVDTAERLLALLGRSNADLRPANTDKVPLPGGEGWPEDDDHDSVAEQVQKTSGGVIAMDSALYLVGAYGTRALELALDCADEHSLAERIVDGRPEIMAQVDFAVREEMAATLTDVMERRTQLFFRDRDQGLGAVEKVATRLSALLGWDETRRASNIDAYRANVEQSRAWRTEE